MALVVKIGRGTMGFNGKRAMRRTMLFASLVMVVQLTLLASFVNAETSPIKIINIDDEFGDGYEREVSANESTIYHWTLFNDGGNYSYNVSLQIENTNDDWTVQLNPGTPISLSPGDAKSITLTVIAPNIAKGSAEVTLTYTILRNNSEIHRDQRSTLTSLTAIEPEEYRVLDWFDNPLPEPLDKEWGVFLLTVVFWLIFSFILILVLDPCVKAATKRTKTEVDDIILRIIRTPVLVLVFFYGVVSSLIILEDQIPKVVIDVLNSIYGVVAVLIIFYVAYKLFKDILVYYGEQLAEKTASNIDNVVIPIVEKIGVVIIGLVALGYLLGYMNIDLTVFVAGGVVISMVIAFAAQETLSNFFSGIFILTDRPFKEEDTIILPDGDWYEVRDIGLRSTRLFRYKDASLISIPNNKLAGDKIINYSNPYDNTRIRKTIGVAYGTDAEKVKKILNEVFEANPHILKEENLKPVIRFDELGESSIDFFIQVIVDDRDNKLDVIDYLNTEIYRRFNEEGIEIPYPQRVVYVKKE
ncbi:MAG: mechanosensitive ion channel [Thermoplasmata archaeon]|nr:MAG: mechanosensitive ion channel [Thermoplasmata archaeon]